ncbi:MAG: metalloregulator ArsR/SmtB family transcription factor [Sumerlaeia bacterium]
MNEEQMEVLIPLLTERFRALADENRLRLLIRLKSGEANVTTLSNELGLGQASVSKHLGILKRAGLVAQRRDGAQSIYAVKEESIFDVCEVMCDSVRRQHLETLESFGNLYPGQG